MTDNAMQKSMSVSTKQTFQKAFTNIADPLTMAESFVQMQPVYYDASKLWWLWDTEKSCWTHVDDVDIMNAVDEILDIVGTVIPQHRTMILDALQRIGRKNKPKTPAKTWIQFKDTVVDIVTGKTFLATPEYFMTNPIPWESGDSEETPTLDKIFTEWVGEEYLLTLQQLAAYCLLPDYPLRRIFCLLGDGSNGKSKYQEFIRRFIGSENTTASEFDIIATSRFESSRLYKRLACFMSELNYVHFHKTAAFKRLTGQDFIGFEFKHKPHFEGFTYAKIIIATNSLPTTSDTTTGFYHRWIIILFPNYFSEKIDILETIPEQEYKNFARKSIRLLQGLLHDGEFSKEGTLEHKKTEYERHSNSVKEFIKTDCELGIDFYVPYSEFYTGYIAYTKANNLRTLTKPKVGKLLRDAGYEVERRTIREPVLLEDGAIDGSRTMYRSVHVIEGLQIKIKQNNTHITNNTILPTYFTNKETNTKQGNIGNNGNTKEDKH